MPKKQKGRRSSSKKSKLSTPKSEQRAKLFWTGRSQAVRLPKEVRFAGEAVLIRRDGDRVILEPDRGWPPGYIDWLKAGPHLPEDFELPDDPPPEPLDALDEVLAR